MNPNATSDPETTANPGDSRSRSTKRSVTIGFFFGAVPPIAFGMYRLQQEWAYIASLGPNEPACGMPVLGALFMIVMGGPVCGIAGGLCGWIAAVIARWLAR